MRLNKQDPTGSYWYYTDGVSPASNVLSDGYSTFTPGISEINGQGSRFYLADASGNSRGLLNSSQAATDGYNWNAFGNLVSRFGSNPTGFAWNVSSGYQTDADDGLTLLGHRYYDKRTGRFISQDPAGDGDNWYQYADNDPMDETDPTGLFTPPYNNLGAGGGQDGTGQMGFGAQDDGWITQGLDLVTLQHTRTGTVTSTVDADGHITHDTTWGPWGPWSEISRTPLGGGMFAGDMQQGPKGTTWRTDMGEADGPDMHIYHDGKLHGPETNIDQNGKLRTGPHHGQKLKALPNKLKKVYRPIVKTFLQRAGMAASAIEEALDGLTLDVPIIYFDPRQADMYAHPEHGT